MKPSVVACSLSIEEGLSTLGVGDLRVMSLLRNSGGRPIRNESSVHGVSCALFFYQRRRNWCVLTGVETIQ